jgi:hypothetical protein
VRPKEGPTHPSSSFHINFAGNSSVDPYAAYQVQSIENPYTTFNSEPLPSSRSGQIHFGGSNAHPSSDSGHRGKRSLEQPPNTERDRSSKSRTRTTSIGKPFLPDLNQTPADSALLPQTPRPTQPSPEVHQRLDPSQQRHGIPFPDGRQLDIKNITTDSVHKAYSYMARTNIYSSCFEKNKNNLTDDQEKYLSAVKHLQAIEDLLREGSYKDTRIQESITKLLTLASEIEDIRNALSMIHEKSQMPQPDTRRTNPRGTGAKKGLSSSPQLVDISSDDEA